MKIILKSLILSMTLSGLSFAATNPPVTTGTGTGTGGAGTRTGTGTGSGTTGTGTTVNPVNNGTSNTAPRNTGTGGTTTERLDPSGRGVAPLDVPATGSGTTEKGITPQPGVSSRITGTVESIDPSGNRVRVRDSAGRVTEYRVNNKTNFSSGGKKGKFTDVKTGDPVNFDTNSELGIINLDVGAQSK